MIVWLNILFYFCAISSQCVSLLDVPLNTWCFIYSIAIFKKKKKKLHWIMASLYFLLSGSCIPSCSVLLSSIFKYWWLLPFYIYSSCLCLFLFSLSPGKTSTISWRPTMNTKDYLDVFQIPLESIRYTNIHATGNGLECDSCDNLPLWGIW